MASFIFLQPFIYVWMGYLEVLSFILSYYFKRTISSFCWPFTSLRAATYYFVFIKFFYVMLQVNSPQRYTPSTLSYFCPIYSLCSSSGIGILCLLSNLSSCYILCVFLCKFYYDSLVILSQAQSYSLRCMFTQSLSLSLAAKFIKIIFCFSNRSESGEFPFSNSNDLILFSYSFILFICSSSNLSQESFPVCMSCELNAFIFSQSNFFCYLSLQNSCDVCCKALITLFLSYSILRFYYSSWISFDLSISTLFFCYNYTLKRVSSFSYFLISAFWSKSQLMSGLFLMLLALCANFREDKDQRKASGEGEIMVSMVVLQLPPRLSLSNRVRTEFLQGMWVWGLLSVRAPITIPKQLKLTFMFLHYSNLLPDAPDTRTLYDPAKSTKFSLATFNSLPSVSLSVSFICSILMMKTACDREEDSFMFVLAMALERVPNFINSRISCGLTTAHSETPQTYTPFFGSSLIWRFFFSFRSRSLTFSLQICMYEALTMNVISSSLLPASMYEKISSMALGMMPLFSSVKLYLKPSIVYVFPVPVCPQAKMVALYPQSAEHTDNLAVLTQTSS